MIHVEDTRKGSQYLLENIKVKETVDNVENDGVEFINIYKGCKTKLGSMLRPGYIKPFNTILGKTASVRMFLNAVTLKNFDLNLVSKLKLNKADLANMPTKTVSVTNYWSLLCYALCARVSADKELQALMKQNTLPYIVLDKPVTGNFFGMSVQLNKIKPDSVKYVAMVELIAKMLKEDTFTSANIEQLCLDLRTDKTKNILDGIACLDKLNIITGQQLEKQAAQQQQQPPVEATAPAEAPAEEVAIS